MYKAVSEVGDAFAIAVAHLFSAIEYIIVYIGGDQEGAVKVGAGQDGLVRSE